MSLFSDPVTLATIISFSGSLVVQKCADASAEALFARASAFLSERFGRAARAADVAEATLASVPDDLADLARLVASESPVLRRAARVADALRGARLLWVDDDPSSVAYEIRALEGLGVSVVTVTSTAEATGALAAAAFDVVVSDVARPDAPDAGIRMCRSFHDHGVRVPVLLYLGALDRSRGVPPYAFGITSRPDDLFHLVMDALERTRLPAAPTGQVL